MTTTNLAPSRFHRSRSNRMIGGVCAGLARDLGVDLNLLRILAVVSLFASGGLAVVAYIAGWALLPELD
jgi:phage shock protein PspC (stress-responsive transcriptional regulator)